MYRSCKFYSIAGIGAAASQSKFERRKTSPNPANANPPIRKKLKVFVDVAISYAGSRPRDNVLLVDWLAFNSSTSAFVILPSYCLRVIVSIAVYLSLV